MSIINGDGIAGMAGLPENSVDLLLTDPPYKDFQSNRVPKARRQTPILKADFDPFMFICQAARVVKPGRHFICWLDDLTFLWVRDIYHFYFDYKSRIVWEKNNHGCGDLRYSFASRQEYAVHALRRAESRDQCVPLSNRLETTFNAPKVKKSVSAHPTAKPVEILTELIRVTTSEGELVCDPYAGGGSTLVAAKKMGRRYIGWEINSEMAKEAERRLR